MPRGSSAKREREYKELKEEFEESGRYKGREEEVAARIVNKQRSELGETKEARKQDRRGKSPDRGLPIANYDNLTVAQAKGKLNSLSQSEIEKIKNYEKKHKNRKTMMETIQRKLEQ